MDSSEAELPPTAATAPASSPVQESPFSNFISSLSPINPVKASHVIQGCLALNSPPLVFTTPRVNTNREANLLERLQPFSRDTILFLGSDGGNATDDGTAASCRIESSVIHYQEVFIAHTKDGGAGKSLQVQTSDSSGSIIGYLADPVDPDCLNSADSCTNSKLSVTLFESSVEDHVGSKNTAQEIDEKNVTDSEAEGVIMSLVTKFDEEFEKKLNSNEKIEEESNASERPHHAYSTLLSDPIKLDSMTQKLRNCHVQSDGNDRSEGSPQQLDLSLQVLGHEVPAENVEATLDASSDLEVSQHLRGISRRCLQFGEAQGNAKSQGFNVSNLFTDVPLSNSLSKAPGIEGVDSNRVDLSTSRKTKLVNIAQILAELPTKNNCEKSPLAFSKPSGIGLHLNSIVRAIPMASHGTENMKSASLEKLASVRRTYSRERTKTHLNAIDEILPLEKLASVRRTYSRERTKTHLNAIDEILPLVKDGTLETSNFTLAGGSYEPLSSEEQMEHHATPDSKRKFILDQPENHEECDQQSIKKKRKKSSSTVDEDGCKHCNCKKSKCLKLYCDCFAAGIYCAGPCACRECLNRPEYQDRVLETRRQIESRNPLAFAPKIIQLNVNSPINGREDGNLKTPLTAKHQRGCNCKRSMCLKKYCECYQANVGCSAGCRCEGCKNVYGTREGYHPSEELMSSRIYCEGTINGKLEMVATKEDCLSNELPNPSYHTPLTPSFPCSENEKDASETCFLSRRCPTSPESGLTVLSSYAKCSRNSGNIDIVLEGSEDKSADESHSQRMDLNNASKHADICHLSPTSNCPSASMASASSKASGLSNVTQFQFHPRSGCISGRSLRWRGSHSPLTPVLQSDGPKKFQEPGSDVGSCCILEDDTPELLKDASIPGKPVKAGSPNGKRVSPPHTVRELGSSCSGRLRSGRKFILKAVPSFPPLTPCVELKGSTNQDSSIQDTDSTH